MEGVGIHIDAAAIDRSANELRVRMRGNSWGEAVAATVELSYDHTALSIVNYSDFENDGGYLMDLGVVTAVEFDAGGSSTVMYKPKNSPTMKKLVGGGRTLSMMMYFTE